MKRLFFILTLSILFFGFTEQTKKRIIFFGNSITQAAVRGDGYIVKLDSIIQVKGKGDIYELIGAGISGHRVENLYNRLDKDVLSKNPDAVVIWIGVKRQESDSPFWTVTWPET